eukprot:jgi/Chlat1/8880/Chrsp92S08229
MDDTSDGIVHDPAAAAAAEAAAAAAAAQAAVEVAAAGGVPDGGGGAHNPWGAELGEGSESESDGDGHAAAAASHRGGVGLGGGGGGSGVGGGPGGVGGSIQGGLHGVGGNGAGVGGGGGGGGGGGTVSGGDDAITDGEKHTLIGLWGDALEKHGHVLRRHWIDIAARLHELHPSLPPRDPRKLRRLLSNLMRTYANHKLGRLKKSRPSGQTTATHTTSTLTPTPYSSSSSPGVHHRNTPATSWPFFEALDGILRTRPEYSAAGVGGVGVGLGGGGGGGGDGVGSGSGDEQMAVHQQQQSGGDEHPEGMEMEGRQQRKRKAVAAPAASVGALQSQLHHQHQIVVTAQPSAQIAVMPSMAATPPMATGNGMSPPLQQHHQSPAPPSVSAGRVGELKKGEWKARSGLDSVKDCMCVWARTKPYRDMDHLVSMDFVGIHPLSRAGDMTVRGGRGMRAYIQQWHNALVPFYISYEVRDGPLSNQATSLWTVRGRVAGEFAGARPPPSPDTWLLFSGTTVYSWNAQGLICAAEAMFDGDAVLKQMEGKVRHPRLFTEGE